MVTVCLPSSPEREPSKTGLLAWWLQAFQDKYYNILMSQREEISLMGILDGFTVELIGS